MDGGSHGVAFGESPRVVEGVRHASGVARSSRDEVEMRARVEDAGGDGRDLERGRPAGGVSRRLGRLALEETLHGDAGHALVHGLRATAVVETLETNLAGTGGVPRRSAGAARAAVGAAVDAVDAANARPARVVVREVGVVAPAVPATPRGLALGRTPVARRRVVVGGRGTGRGGVAARWVLPLAPAGFARRRPMRDARRGIDTVVVVDTQPRQGVDDAPGRHGERARTV